jgi:stringent starvation protein B
VLALYAQENGQGMMFPAEGEGSDNPPPSEPPPDDPASGESEGADKPKRGAPHLRVIK